MNTTQRTISTVMALILLLICLCPPTTYSKHVPYSGSSGNTFLWNFDKVYALDTGMLMLELGGALMAGMILFFAAKGR